MNRPPLRPRGIKRGSWKLPRHRGRATQLQGNSPLLFNDWIQVENPLQSSLAKITMFGWCLHASLLIVTSHVVVPFFIISKRICAYLLRSVNMQGGYLKTCSCWCFAAPEKLHFANAGESNGQKCIGEDVVGKLVNVRVLGPKTMCGRQIARLVSVCSAAVNQEKTLVRRILMDVLLLLAFRSCLLRGLLLLLENASWSVLPTQLYNGNLALRNFQKNSQTWQHCIWWLQMNCVVPQDVIFLQSAMTNTKCM